MTNQYAMSSDGSKIREYSSWNSNKHFRYVDMEHNSSLYVKKSSSRVAICYSFSPKKSIIVLPMLSVVLLYLFSFFLVLLRHLEQHYPLENIAAKVSEYDIPLALFITAVSLTIPRFISNPEIRHKYVWFYFYPVFIAALFLIQNNV